MAIHHAQNSFRMFWRNECDVSLIEDFPVTPHELCVLRSNPYGKIVLGFILKDIA